MIILDFNGITLSNITVQKLEIEENLIRHMVLNSIRLYRKKFRHEYGEIVIATDAGNNWRKDYYPFYKANRGKTRDSDPEYWNEVFDILNMIRDELDEFTPYKVLHINKCEADDIIATLVEHTQEFGNYEPVMIVSADKDFAQLQRYNNVAQYSYNTKKFIKEKDPQRFLFEHICKGDGSDGVPNILSADNIFLQEGVRQTPLRQTKIDAWYQSKNLESDMSSEEYRNFQRNKRMIDLKETPIELQQEIINRFNEQKDVSKNTLFNYLLKKRCKRLLEDIDDFTR